MHIILIFSLHYLILFETFISAATLSNRPNEKCHSSCTTPVCKKEAEFFTKNMDTTVDPCSDFFQFVCGNFLKTPIPADKASITQIDLVQDKIRNQLDNVLKTPIKSSDLKAFKNVKLHYQNCLNESGIEKIGVTSLLALIEKLGGWPVLLGDKWNEKDYKWEDSVSKISEQGFHPLFPFTLWVDPDPANTSHYILEVYWTFTTIDESYFTPGSNNLEAYERFLIETAVLLGATRENAASELKECLNFEVELHKIKIQRANLHAVSPTENRISLKNLSDKYSDMPWLDIFNRILNPSNISVNENELLVLSDPQFVSKIGELIGKTPKRVLANYQIWTVISDVINYLPQSFRNNKFKFDQATRGLEKAPKRENACFDLIKDTIDVAMGSMYVKSYFDKKSKEAANEIIQNIKEQLKSTLSKVPWMDEETRKNALEKLQAMKYTVGYPDELSDDEKIENYYKDLEINSGNFFQDYCKISNYSKNQVFNKLRKSMAETQWMSDRNVATVDARYDFPKNKLQITAGTLQEPFFKFKRPDYLNYGGIGYILGHEMIHGFDSKGRNYDKIGEYNNWWDNNTANEFENNVKCLIDQYNGYTVKQINQKMDGDLTKDENIADAGGIKLAYNAYQNFANNKGKTEQCLPSINYSPQQMFWISAASVWCGKFTDQEMRKTVTTDWHSPAEARINVAFSNIQEFADDFKCPIGSKMNPTDKCIVW